MDCIDCKIYEVCPDAISKNTVECFILRDEPCLHCKESLQPSNSEITDLSCPVCLREYEVHHGRLICTI